MRNRVNDFAQLRRSLKIGPVGLATSSYFSQEPPVPLGEPHRRHKLGTHSQGTFLPNGFQEFSLYDNFFKLQSDLTKM